LRALGPANPQVAEHESRHKRGLSCLRALGPANPQVAEHRSRHKRGDAGLRALGRPNLQVAEHGSRHKRGTPGRRKPRSARWALGRRLTPAGRAASDGGRGWHHRHRPRRGNARRPAARRHSGPADRRDGPPGNSGRRRGGRQRGGSGGRRGRVGRLRGRSGRTTPDTSNDGDHKEKGPRGRHTPSI
jgi:hypothetical protein